FSLDHVRRVMTMSNRELQAAEVVALVGGTVIDGNGGAPIKDGVIVIDGKRIIAIGVRTTPIPPQAKISRVEGKFIIPGFIGLNSHVTDDLNTLVKYEGRYDELALEAAQIFLMAGFTTVVDQFGPRDDL